MWHKSSILTILSVLVFSTLLNACQLLPEASVSPDYQTAEVLFRVVLPAKLADGTKLQLEILDDVTGLAFNPKRYDMIQKDERNYYFKTTLTQFANVRYRYLAVGASTLIETNSQGQEVRFRLLNVNNPIAVTDYVASWPDLPYQGGVGSVVGQFFDSAANTPLPNLLVSIQGVQTLTASDGSFSIHGITPGTHNLVAMALDGTFADFQQEAVVAENAVTPVSVGLQSRPAVNVEFRVTLPANTNVTTPLRLASNLYSLGNLYADIYAGNTMLAADLPVMQKVSDTVYSLNLSLPAGAYFNYKYTLGDGFWNAELTADGAFVSREFIVPQKAASKRDTIQAFQSPNSAPITIQVTVPTHTPVEDTVTIQFNPFQWMAPIPMSKVDATHWSFTLLNPQGYFSQTKFRFCRNSICDLTHEIEPQDTSQTRALIPGSSPQTITANVDGWQLLTVSQSPTSVTTEPQGSMPRTDFITGFEVDFMNAPLLRSSEPTLMASLAATGANWIIVQPTWSIAKINPVVFEPFPGRDLLWPDVLTSVQNAKQAGMSAAIFPRLQFPEGSTKFWQDADKDPAWWQYWFDGYHRFMIQNADAANLSGAAALILGDPVTSPSFSSGKLPDGTSSNAPSTADDQWRQLITDIRARYSGPIIGAFDLSVQGTELPGWFDRVDAVYLITYPVLSADAVTGFSSTFDEVDAYLENTLKPVAENAGRPILLGLSVPSTKDAYAGCGETSTSCAEDTSMMGSTQGLDLELQARITNAFIMRASTKPYINGFFSRGYQPAGSLQDSSISVHGKPANDVLWYWYHFLGGKPQ